MSDKSTSSTTVTETPVSFDNRVETVEVSARSSMGVSEDSQVEEPASEAVEASPSEEPAPAPVKERISPKLAQLRAREAEAAQKSAEAESRLAEANEKLAKIELLKKQPVKALAELGLSFNDLATAMLSEGEEEGQTPNEIDTLRAEVEALKSSLEAKEKAQLDAAEAAQEKQLETAITNIKHVIHQHIEANPDEFDMVRVTNNQDLVYEIMEESWRQRGELKHYTDAAKLAENFLYERAKKLTESKKLREAFTPTPNKSPTRTSFGKTLTSQLGQMTSSNGKPDLSRMSHDERIRYLSKNVLRFNN